MSSTIVQALRKSHGSTGRTTEADDEFVTKAREPNAHTEKRATARVAATISVIALFGLLLGVTVGWAVQRFSTNSVVEAEVTSPVAPTRSAVVAPPSARKPDTGKPDTARGVADDIKRVAAPPNPTAPASPTASGPALAAAGDLHTLAPTRTAAPPEPGGRERSEKPPVLTVAAAAPAGSPPKSDPSAAPMRLFQDPVTLDGGASVEVLGNQHASVIGEATSLHAVVEELCRQAGIELRMYAAPDRPYVGRLQDLPLQEMLRSLFRSESYLVGMSLDESSHEMRVTWLSVLGAGTGGTPQRALASTSVPGPTLVKPNPRPAQKAVLSPTLMYEAFGTMDPARREQAQREALDRLAQPDQRAVFLNTDASVIANAAANYEHSAEAIRNMKSMTELPDVQAKLDEVLSAMGESQDRQDSE